MAQLLVGMGLVLLGVVNLSGRMPVEVAGLLVLLLLMAVGVIPPAATLSGFGSEAFWLVTGMLIVGETIRRSGLLARAADGLTALCRGSSARLYAGLTVMGAVSGGLLESTAAVTALLPVAATAARRVRAVPEQAFASVALGGMAGGLLTLIGTSGNIVANAILVKLGVAPLGFLTLMPLGLGFLAISVAYVARPRPAPNREQARLVEVRAYVGEVRVREASPLAGRALAEIPALRDRGITVLRIFRDGRSLDAGPRIRLRAGDRLLVSASAEDHLRWDDFPGVEPVTGYSAERDREQFLHQAREVMVPPGSPWVGRTAQDLGLRQEGVELVAIWRQGSTLAGSLPTVPFRVGDMLLVVANARRLRDLDHLGVIVPVSGPETMVQPGRGRGLALVPLAVFLVLAVATPVGLGVAALAGAVLALILGRYPPEEIYRAVEWRVPLFIGAMLPVATAVARTGLARRLADGVVLTVGAHPAFGVVALYILAAVMTQVLSNIATAAVLTPVAVDVAARLHMTPLAFVVAVLAALMMTPLSGTANKPALLLMARGVLRHRDYWRWGLLPSIAGAVLALAMILWVF